MARLSEQLAELSRRAKAAEDAADAARAETREALAARVDQARTNAEQRANQLGDRAAAAAQDASDRWSEIQDRWKDQQAALRGKGGCHDERRVAVQPTAGHGPGGRPGPAGGLVVVPDRGGPVDPGSACSCCP